MSRIGKLPVAVPDKVKVEVGKDRVVVVEGPKGRLQLSLPEGVSVDREGANLAVVRESEQRRHRANHGTARALLSNMITGVTKGFTKQLEIRGVGYRAKVEGQFLDLQLGYSHPVKHPIPTGLEVKVDENTKITINGIDKQEVGQFAAEVRSYRPPEPYKGKGVRYSDEYVRRKAGKSVK
jgi:large subunit ribosomal protein L6